MNSKRTYLNLMSLSVMLFHCGGESGMSSDASDDVSVTDAKASTRLPDASLKLDGAKEAAKSSADARIVENDARTTASDATTIQPDAAPPIEPGDPGAAEIKVEVRSDTNVHPISPFIYGINGVRDLGKNRQTLTRSGGNRLTAYNWENNASNAGSDWQFQNDDLLSKNDQPAKAVTDLIDTASAAQIATLLTVPIVDYVAADKNGGGDVRASGANYLSTRFKQNLAEKGSAPSAVPNTADAFVYQDEFVAFLKNRNSGARILFSLDNEPELWSSTHAEVHPEPVTYAELWERNYRFAKAIKRVWPEAEVTGFVSYGFNGYVTLQNANDNNNRDFIEWYLDQARAAEKSEGRRLIDYLDLHWYPEARGGGVRITETNSGDAVVQAREQAPRSLWDSTYSESSWIRDYLGGPVDLLHWIFKKIDAHYPGMKLAFTEWNYGAGDHISGAIATADVLGIFGREQVALAARWPLQDDESFADAAFRVYRNYDGQGATFGDTSIQATSSDVASVTAYASTDSQQSLRLVIVLINKAKTTKTVAVSIAHPSAFTKARVFLLSAARAEVVRVDDVAASATNAFKLLLPAQSVSVIEPQQ
jgi:hypothetical protein